VRILVVDDESAARSRLARLLSDISGIEIAEAADGLTALRLIAAQQPDAVFLDVQMPGLSGFEVVTALPAEGRPSVVFVTAFDQYALKAFEVSAVDYLLKPVTADRVSDAVNRLLTRRPDGTLARLSRTLDQGSPLTRVVGKHLQQWHVLPIDTIEAFISDHELVFAVTAQGRFLVNRTLRDLEARLDPDRFVRIHKRAIVRIVGLVVTQESTGRFVATLPSGLLVAVSRRHVAALRQRLDW
jgi:two-component system, LytTR family, response regulator